MNTPEQSQLGKSSAYVDQYDASLLFPIPRLTKREEIGAGSNPPFFGADLWTAFELSWLNLRGKPQVALVHFTIPCETPNLIESKSFKLYLNSFNNTRFAHIDEVRDRLRAIEALLRETEHWQETAPDSSAFASDKPFCLDTLEPLEWLQWVLIPRMHQLLESGQPLPQNFAVAPYYEMALDQAHPVRESMLAELLLLDALFAGEQA